MERKNGLFGSRKLRHGRDIAVFLFSSRFGSCLYQEALRGYANGGEPGRASDDGLASIGQIFNLHPLHGGWRGGERNAARAAHRLSRYGRLERREQLKRCRR